jgi:hypothetical protein
MDMLGIDVFNVTRHDTFLADVMAKDQRTFFFLRL